jgi:hypothetical protein
MQDNANQQFDTLPTGKPHISFSELRDWQDCSYRHKLRHIKGIDLSTPSPILDFGTAVHASCEDFLKTKVMNANLATDMLSQNFDSKKIYEGFTEKALSSYKKEAIAILAEVPQFLIDTFGEWETVDAEHMLYESINNQPHAFKGFIDCILKTKDKKGKEQYWIIDWKTTAWGWGTDKKTDFKLHQQLIFYKNFWSKKANIDPKKIKCGFVLLKRTAKAGSKCELVPVSVGDVTSTRAFKNIGNMLSSLKKGIAIKNKESCTYCQFKGTEHCT